MIRCVKNADVKLRDEIGVRKNDTAIEKQQQRQNSQDGKQAQFLEMTLIAAEHSNSSHTALKTSSSGRVYPLYLVIAVSALNTRSRKDSVVLQ